MSMALIKMKNFENKSQARPINRETELRASLDKDYCFKYEMIVLFQTVLLND